MDSNCDCEKIINGIKCNVRNCAFHLANDHCGAGQIHVGPSDATSQSDTKCATFESKF